MVTNQTVEKIDGRILSAFEANAKHFLRVQLSDPGIQSGCI
jgi:hypothetical protein